MTTRQQFIHDVVEHYIKNNKEDNDAHVKWVKKRQERLSDKLGRTKDKKGQAQISLPEKLHSILDYALDNPRFLGESKELRWFAKKFPQYQIPYEL